MTLKLGSLFSGSGGFELAGVMNGIEPVWASEIEKYPIAVTMARFPNMKHLGDITKINGAEIEPVDIVTFGFPCQDLSVAGKQAGLHGGERSILFYEAVRIIKEMRDATDGVCPRIAVFENVPGLFSSRKGEDFRAVLETLIRVKDPDAVVPLPQKGKWLNAGCVVGNGYSLAYRLFDAQFWGVPQRRKRIYAIADFGSERAGEILFEQEGLRGDTAESGTQGQGAARDVKGGVRGSVFNESGKGYWMPRCGCLRAEGENRPSRPGHIVCLNPHESQSQRIYDVSGVYPCLSSNESGGLNRQAVCFQQNQREEVRSLGEQTGAIAANAGAHQTNYVCENIDLIRESRGAFEKYEESATKAGALKQCDEKGSQVIAFEPGALTRDMGNRCWDNTAPTLRANMGDNQPGICYVFDRYNGEVTGDVTQTLAGLERMCNAPHVCYALDQQGGKGGANYSENIAPPLMSDSHGTPHGVCYALDRASFNQGRNAQYDIQIERELNSSLVARGPSAVCYDARGNGNGQTVPTITGDHAGHISDYTQMLTYSAGNGQLHQSLECEIARPLDCMHDQQMVLVKERKNVNTKKDGCREILLGLWEAYVEEDIQGSIGEQQGIQRTDILRPEVHGGTSDKPTQDRNEQRVLPCDCAEGSGCWVLRNMREIECARCTPQGRQLPEQQSGELNADLPWLPQQTAQDSEDMQSLWGESQGSRILQQALHTVQEVWKSVVPQRKYIIRRLSPLECARLQGFPDLWESGVAGSDSGRYRMWGNGIALPNAEFVVRKAKQLLTTK